MKLSACSSAIEESLDLTAQMRVAVRRRDRGIHATRTEVLGEIRDERGL